MQARIEAKAQRRVDFFSVRRTGKSRKSRYLSAARCVRFSLSPSPSVAGRPSRGLRSVQVRPFPISAAASHVTIPVSDPPHEEKGVRDLGWSRTFAEKFELEDKSLGEGSFGVVKPAVMRETGKRYAAKLIPKNVQGEWDRYSALLLREVTHWKQLQDCQQVVHLEGVYEDDQYLYIVQELCTGGDVQHFIKDNGQLTENEAAQIITPILKMLAACHEKNICFGDVKPANFMLKKPYPCKRHIADPSAPRGDIIVKGIDFGCSQKISEEERLKKRTGTPLYMAPEIFFGWYSVEVDIWAVGMMLYQLIAGRLPFFGEHAEQLKKGPTFMIVQAVMESELDFSGEVWNSVSSDLKDLIRSLLDVDYNTRLTAKVALHHPWIKKYSRDNVIVKGPLGNIIKFPGSSGTPVLRSGGNGDSEDGKDGLGN